MSFTAIQATLAIIIVLTSIPINLLLIAAMVIYRNLLDTSFAMTISVLISNIMASVFLTGTTAITSIARSWLFGYWGCQIFAFIGTCGLFSRWIAIGLVSFDRFCRVFWPFKYQRQEKKAVITLLITSWAIAIIMAAILWSCNSFVFTVVVPGCLFTESPDTGLPETVVTNMVVVLNPLIGLILPGVLYTIMYCKARQIRKKNRVAPVMADNLDTASAKEAQCRANRATITYVLLIVAYVVVNILILGNLAVRGILQKLDVPMIALIPTGFWFSILIRSYVLGDVAILLTNKQQRSALWKLLNKWKLIK